MRSWGRLKQHKQIATDVGSEAQLLECLQKPGLPMGYGRSYGDCGIASSGEAWSVPGLDDQILFNTQTGRLSCSAGTSLGKILDQTLVHGWSLPVSPGTQYVSIAGAIANDIHGKNHHRAGTFGRHVIAFELLRSSGESLSCSSTKNPEWFAATIGGLGLTGVITSAEIQLTKVPSAHFDVTISPFQNLEEFFTLGNTVNDNYDYHVAWLDCAAKGSHLGRGIYMGANPAGAEFGLTRKKRLQLSMPFTPPLSIINRPTVALHNKYYYWKHARLANTSVLQSLDQYLYPLDAISNWNRIYGPKGFHQYQCVVPASNQKNAVKELLSEISKSGSGSFLAVLKSFGDTQSPGWLSFPMFGTHSRWIFPTLLSSLDYSIAWIRLC